MKFSIFGDIDLDLSRDTVMQRGSVTIVSLFGDAKISVPVGTRVATTSATIFGDCRSRVESGDGPDVRVNFFSVFGGLTVLEGKAVALPTLENGRTFPY